MIYWLLTSEYPPGFGGGISTYCFNTAGMMAQNGHSVTVFTNDSAVSDFVVSLQDNIRVIRFNPSRTKSSAFLGHNTNISYEFAHIIKHFIEKEGKPDVIEAQEYLGIAYYLLHYKHLLYDWCHDVPVVITTHSPSFLHMEFNHTSMYRYPNYWICEMERFCLNAAPLLISPGRMNINEISKRFGLNNSNIEFIPNPYKSRFDIKQTGSHRGEIVFYGKLTVQKGAFKLLRYFKDLWDSGFSRPLVIIGGQDILYQPEKITMGDWIKKNYESYLRSGMLKMEGSIEPSAMAGRLADAEVVIFPSLNDNLPYVVFEMMSLGKILLASKQGGQFEVIDNGVDGFIFDHEQPHTFKEQLYKILNLSADERKKISENAIRKISDKYSPEAIYPQKIKALEKLISQKEERQSVFPFIRQGSQQNHSTAYDCIKGLLSVIVPYYNMGAYIDETIQSILASDYTDKEILIINDGSTDETSIKKLEQYKNNPSIKIISGKNKGLATTRNIGAQHAKGEFLAILDADDKIDRNYYSAAVRVLSEYRNIDFVACWTQYFGASNNVWPGFTPEPPIILYHNTVNSSSLVFKKSSFLHYGGNDEAMAWGLEDYEYVVSILAQGGKGVVLPEILFQYRVRQDSMFRGLSKLKKLLLCQHISNKHKNIYATFASDVFNLQNANGPGIALDNPSLDYNLSDDLPFGGRLSVKVISLIKQNRRAKAIAYKLYRWIKK